MSDPFVDTDVLVRLLTGDDPEKQAQAAAMFQQVEAGNITVQAPDTVIADAVYVLSSPRLYNVPRHEVRDMLSALTRLPHFSVDNRRSVLRALELYGATSLDFGDAFIVASMERAGSATLYSYDRDFDSISGVERRPPGSAR
ncbi:MAG TPA: PIN domain-containing protein [Dehalococcoidia bacterium]|nr:PIN domain-containing protein [Dehalococcoidia bacterium]